MFNFSAVRPIKIVSSEVLQHLLQKNTIFVGVKQLLVVILVMLVLGAVVPGCSDATRYDSRLTTADSLMHDNPDSALAIIEAVNRDSLTTEHDRAYRDLLLTQARYKAYIPATSDSDINRALSYYKRHPKEREKLTRAYIYKGAVMEELGHPDSAMFYYKTAETSADPDNYFNLGYSNLRIAQLYQGFYSNDSAVVARMKQATHFFEICKDTAYLVTTIGTQGGYPKILGEDSARFYLEKAILLAKIIHSPKGWQYQSKLVGRYFYCGDFKKAKELAMDIVRNGKDDCNEDQFYYFAVRSYIRLGLMDSALWIMSLIPLPTIAVDSMNRYQALADLSQATQQYDDYMRYSELAKGIDTRLLEESRGSRLIETELKWDADQQGEKVRGDADHRWGKIIGITLLAIAIMTVIAYFIVKRHIANYRSQLDSARSDVEKMLADIDEKEKQLVAVNKRKLELEMKEQSDINSQVSSIVRYRHAALNELYECARIISVTDDGKKSVLPLMRIVKDLFEQKGILRKPLSKNFWKNLRISVDGEFHGIASFVEQNYPDMSDKDMQLFMLMCAHFPNQIIKIIMNYTNDVTASRNKKRIMKDNFGLDTTKVDDFIQIYLHEKHDAIK